MYTSIGKLMERLVLVSPFEGFQREYYRYGRFLGDKIGDSDMQRKQKIVLFIEEESLIFYKNSYYVSVNSLPRLKGRYTSKLIFRIIIGV